MRNGYIREETKENREQNNPNYLFVLVITLFGLATLLIYSCFFFSQQSATLAKIKEVLIGLGGSLSVALPLMLVWVGTLCAASVRGRKISAICFFCDLLLVFVLFAAVHLFFAGRIVRERMTVSGFSNFVAKSYGYGRGGGAIGALLAWPLYRYLGVAGGFIVVLLAVVALLIISGHLSRLIRRDRGRKIACEEAEDRSNSCRMQKRDPYSEAIMGGTEKAEKLQKYEFLDDSENMGFDEFDRLEAESAAMDAAERALRTRMSVKATKKNNLSIDDLKIELEAYKSLKTKRVESAKKEVLSYNYPPIDLLDQQKTKGIVHLREVLESPDVIENPSHLAVGLGKDINNHYIVADIEKMPHLLIGGRTGSGKSVCINVIITSLLFRASPEEAKLILIDPKAAELSIYKDIPHLICPVITDPKKATSVLDWAVAEMTKRYKQFAEIGVRNIDRYNKTAGSGIIMPRLIIIIDDLSELMMIAPKEIEDSICRITQMGYNTGIHLIVSTNHASAKIVTSAIKENIPSRIAFSTVSYIESRMILNETGAEKLSKKGELLFKTMGYNPFVRVQGTWVSDEEVQTIVNYIVGSNKRRYDKTLVAAIAEYDPRLPEAIDIVIDMGQASISMLQRRMRIGYAKAGRLIDEMAQRGIVSEADGAKPRQVLVSREQAQAMFEE